MTMFTVYYVFWDYVMQSDIIAESGIYAVRLSLIANLTNCAKFVQSIINHKTVRVYNIHKIVKRF